MVDDVKGWVSEVSTKLKNNYRIDLLDRIKSCKEGNKLRTYASFKHVIKFDPYLNIVKNYNCRKTLSKFTVCLLEFGRVSSQ